MITFLKTSIFCILLFAATRASSQTTINLSKPVSQSLNPDTLYWPCDDGTPGTSFPEEVLDLSGNGFDGKLLPGNLHPQPIYAEGKFGTAIQFHGDTPPVVGDDGKETPRNPNPSIRWRLRDTPGMAESNLLDMAGKSFTAGLWIKVEKFNSGTTQTIMLMNRGYVPERQWAFMLIKDDMDAWTLRVQGMKNSIKTDALNDAGWHHLAFSLDSESEGTSTVTYWLDGEVLGEPVSALSVIKEPESDAERVLRVGERNVGDYSSGFAGLIDEVFVTTGVHIFQP
jgi:hypothetical protein